MERVHRIGDTGIHRIDARAEFFEYAHGPGDGGFDVVVALAGLVVTSPLSARVTSRSTSSSFLPNPSVALKATRRPSRGRSPLAPSRAAARYPPGPGVVARAGTADQSRGSGRRRASMNAAVSPTVRVMGPACARVPNGLEGNMGMTP